MSLIVLYLGIRYDVCECNSLRLMTISSFFVTFDLRLWPSSSVKVTFIFIIRWTLYFCVLVPSTKFVNSIEFEIWKLWNLITNRSRVYLSDIPNFILIKYKRAEIQGREVNRELRRKNGYWATVTLTFCSQTESDTQTHTQTNCSENITPPRFRGSVTTAKSWNKDHWPAKTTHGQDNPCKFHVE